MRFTFVLFALFLLKGLVYAQNDTTFNLSIYDLSMEKLMSIEVSTATKNKTILSESPGIITLVTEEDIKNSGARDIIDVLNLVPGFDFGAEWDNIIGLGIRGNNATEGKFLLLYNGFQMNETNFGAFPFGGHILTDNIKKIEIIRGPGSVVYGGSAELAVINIITKTENEAEQGFVSSSYGFSNDKSLSYSIQSSYVQRFTSGLSVQINAYRGKTNQSNRLLTTLDSTEINYADSSEIYSDNLSLMLNYKNFDASFMYDRYSSQNIEAEGRVLFDGLFYRMAYTHKLNSKLHLIPEFSWKKQKPWFFLNYPEKEFYNVVNQQLSSDVRLNYLPNNRFSYDLGVNYTRDHSAKFNEELLFSSNNKNSISFNSLAAFSEVFYKTDYGNLIAGARFEYHDKFGDAFVPRIAYTNVIQKLNFKLMYSKAFKAPTIANLDYNPNIQAEITNVYELESKYHFTKTFNLGLSLFHIIIKNPILYIPNPTTGADYYANFLSTGSRGYDLNANYKSENIKLRANYSYYQQSNNTVEAYTIETDKTTYGAFPKHKFSMNVNLRISKKINLNATLIAYGKRYTYIHSDRNWSSAQLITYNPDYTANVVVAYQDFLVKDLDLSFSIHDLTNRQFEYLNSYQGWQNQLPAPGRVFSLKLYYAIKRAPRFSPDLKL